jgi:hypothetical protein
MDILERIDAAITESAPLRRCLAPGCSNTTDRSPSPDFCSESCQNRWAAAGAERFHDGPTAAGRALERSEHLASLAGSLSSARLHEMTRAHTQMLDRLVRPAEESP